MSTEKDFSSPEMFRGRSISNLENETTWRRRRLDQVYLEYEKIQNSGSIKERNLVLPIAGSSATLVDAPICEIGKDPKRKDVAKVEEVGDGEQFTPKANINVSNEGEGMKLEGKELVIAEEGGREKGVDGNLARTTTLAVPSHISFSSDSDK